MKYNLVVYQIDRETGEKEIIGDFNGELKQLAKIMVSLDSEMTKRFYSHTYELIEDKGEAK